MGIFKRVKTVVKANLNDMISKVEDPEKMLNQLLLDMQEQYTKAKAEVTLAIADQKKLERLHQEHLRLQKEWMEKAELAVEKGNDTLAMEALKRKAEYEGLANQYKVQLDGQKQAVEKLKESLRQLNDKIEEANRKKQLLIARTKRAKAEETIQRTFTNINDTSVFANFERMERKVEDLEVKASAYTEITNEIEIGGLAKEFEELEKGSQDEKIIDELQRMKERVHKTE